MTVNELIGELKTCPSDYKVVAWERSGDIEEIYGISIVCDETQSVALSGKMDNTQGNIFKLEIPALVGI